MHKNQTASPVTLKNQLKAIREFGFEVISVPFSVLGALQINGPDFSTANLGFTCITQVDPHSVQSQPGVE